MYYYIWLFILDRCVTIIYEKGDCMNENSQDEIIAYKAFDEGLVNRYGEKFEIGKIYNVQGKVKWGNNGNGFHMCKNPENCFRYFDSESCELTLVRGFGEMIHYDDEYNAYYDMYVCQGMEILKVLTHEEIIALALNLYTYRIKNFLRTFKLTKEEIEIFKEVYKQEKDVLDFISYYQEDKNVFVKKRGIYSGRNNCKRS